LRTQTLADIEILCVDDASTDESATLLADVARHDLRIKVLRHPVNRGLSAARNTGIKSAAAPWVLFVDSDDIVSRRICERTLAAAAKNQADVVFFTHAAFQDGQPLPPEPLAVEAQLADRRALLRRPAFAWTKLIRTELLRTKDIQFPVGLCFEDVPVHWRLALESARPVFLDEALVWYRQRAGSITYRTDWSRADGIIIHDQLGEWLQRSGEWTEYGDFFLLEQMRNFATTYAFFSILNPRHVPRLTHEAKQRITPRQWQLALSSPELFGWMRDYILTRCRPIHIAWSWYLVRPFFQHSARHFLRLVFHAVRRLFRFKP
jgi:glycosyltransferase involved in cell wall biosynthesis